MAFDAGAIIARLDLDDADFDRKLRADVARIEQFEKEHHGVKLTPDTSDLARARRTFATLDRQLTTDAQARARSGGSVLGALMGLTSSRVAGQPSASQTAIARTIRDIGSGGGAAGGGGGGGFFRQLAGAAGPVPNNLLGGIGLKGLAITSGVGLGAAALPALAGLGAVAGVGGAGLGIAGLLGAQAAGPATQLAGARSQAQQALAAAVTPAQVKAAQAQLASVNQQAAALSPALRSIYGSITRLQDWWHKFTGSLAPMIAGPLHQIVPLIMSLAGPIRQVFGGAMTLVMPAARALTGLARQVLPLLGQAFRAAAPSIGPLITGLGRLLAGILPGLIALLKAVQPVIKVLAGTLGTLGGAVGKMLADFAPVIKQSAIVFKALMDVISALFPIIGVLAQVFAKALAPVVKDLAAIFKALTPTLVIIGKLVAELVSAALGDLVALFGALAKVVVIISPALAQLAGALSGVFTILENSGVFGVLASALEGLAVPIGKLIVALIRGLVPIIPPVIKFFGDLLGILTAGLISAVEQLLPPLTTLAIDILGALASVLPVVLPILTAFLGIFTTTVVGVITGIADALNWFLSQFTPGQLRVLIEVGLAVFYLYRMFVLAKTAFMLLQDVFKAGPAIMGLVTNPVFLIIAAIALLAFGIFELVKHWKQVWGDIKNWARDAWEFLTHGWGQFLFPALYLIRKVVEFVRDHWKQAWTDIKNWALDAWHFIHDDVVAPLANFFIQSIPHAFDVAWNHIHGWWVDVKNAFTGGWNWIHDNVLVPWHDFIMITIPNAFTSAVNAIKRIWHTVEGVVFAPVQFVINDVLDNLIKLFNNITSAIGLGKLKIPMISISAPAGGFAGGGKITGGSGPLADDVLARVSRGETVVSAAHSQLLSPVFEALGIPGYARGGVPSGGRATATLGKARATNDIGPGVIGKVADIGKIVTGILTGNATAATNALYDMFGHRGAGGAAGTLAAMLLKMPAEAISGFIHWAIGQAGSFASGNAIVQKALSFVGKVPYVWGGSSPAGWDCSGMVEWIYNFFGIHPPRTSQAQFGWVRRTPAPVPGGLAFFAGADGTQASPGHVGIAINGQKMVNAFGTGFGTIISNIAGSSGAISGFGVPPFGAVIPGAGLAVGGDAIQWIKMAMADTFAPASWLPALETLVSKESGGNPRAVNPVTVNGEHASGLFQTLPSTYAAYATVPGGVFNPVSDAVAGIRYIMSRYGSPFRIPGLMSGSYQGYDSGGWLMPGTTVAVNRTGRPEAVLPADLLGGQDVAQAIRDLHEEVSALLRWLPGATGSEVGDVLNDVGGAAVRRAHYGAR